MGSFRSGGLRLAVAMLSLWSLAGCGSNSKPGVPLFPGRITLAPSGNTSLTLGGIISFSAAAITTTGTTLNVIISYASTDTSILNLAPNGVACAGHWDVAFTTCTPAGTGVVKVTASALGASSAPTYVFVHPPIDSITVSGVLLDGIPVQEPCLSQSQSMTLEAHAFSQGTDITASVGPFSWSASNPTVVNLIPTVNNAYNFATNQATARAVNPGMTHIFASADGVSSSSFQQPQYANSQGTSPLLDFFETCPIRDITLEVGAAGSGRTTFVTSKGTAQTGIATITDVMGNSSLPNTNGGIVLSKIPLTWTSSQPQVVAVSTAGCTESCSITTPSPGMASVSASCSPPNCNIGFPEVPASLSSPAQLAACTQFFHAQFPQLISCQQVIPVPVYASLPLVTNSYPPHQLVATGAISGVVTGAPTSASVLAGSTGCAHEPPSTCNTSVYFPSTARAVAGNENPLPVSPNSLLFDLSGDKVFMGSDFGAEIINPANFGTGNSPFTSLGSVTGRVLASSSTGNIAVFSDTLHTPNQVFVVNAANPNALSASALNITGGVAAAVSPDVLKTYIAGGSTGNSLYVYSSLQALQGPIALSGPAKAITFAPNGAFAFVAEGGSSPNLTAFATCNNQQIATLPLPANPILMKILPVEHIDGSDAYDNSIPDGIHVLVLDSTGFDIITATISAPVPGTPCPQGLQFISGDPQHNPQRIELGQGTIQPVNFFPSSDGTQLYILTSSSSSILIYNFIASTLVGGIELQGNATPVSADISIDAGTIVVAGSDGLLHEVSTSLGGADLVPVSFPNLPGVFNAFCSFTPAAGPCTLNTVLARP